MKLDFDITPVPASRPRFKRFGKPYNAKNYDRFKAYMATLIAMSKTIHILEKPVEMGFHFYMPMAKSWSKKKKEKMRGQLHTQTPDLDNLIKACKDCLTGHAYKDDCHVASYSYARMEWSDEGKIVIELESLA